MNLDLDLDADMDIYVEVNLDVDVDVDIDVDACKNMQQALKLKSTILSTFDQVTAAMEKIYGNEQETPDDAWKWARNEENGGALTAELWKVRSSMTTFHRRILAEDPGDVKRTTSIEEQISGLRTFVKLGVKDLQNAHGTVIMRQNAGPKVAKEKDVAKRRRT